MAFCVLVSELSLGCLRLVPREPLASRAARRKVLALSFVFCVSVVANNISLRFIPVSFNQAISSTDPAFTAFFALALQRRRESRRTYATLIPIVAGTAMASGFELSFHSAGFFFCLAGAASRALKSVLQDSMLTEGEKLHSLNLLKHMAPRCLLFLLPLCWAQEPGALAAARELALRRPAFLWVLLLNCCAAAGVNVTNFLVTRATSALTLQVLGKAKSILAVGASLLLFQNPVSPLGMLGYGICMCGVLAYSKSKSSGGGGGGKGGLEAAPGGAPVESHSKEGGEGDLEAAPEGDAKRAD